jgi:shikimate kinase
MKIYLVGFMGCGKTTNGKRLASRLGFSFLDTDELVSSIHNCSIKDFFDLYSEEIFRQEETNILYQTKTMDNLVVAVGGGTPCFHNNMEWMLSNGMVVYIEMPPLALYNRLLNSKTQRPLLSSLSSNNWKEGIAELFAPREAIYKQAHIAVNGIHLNMDDLIYKLKESISEN